MWVLESTAHSSEGKVFRILGDHKYVVGRQNCDIVVPDPSVSRRQAVLTMAHYETNVAKSFIIPTLTLEDVSKFGTFVNGKPVKSTNGGNNVITLKDNDLIKFGGTPSSVYRARYKPFLATTSCLEKNPKRALQRVMCLLGGHLVRDWRPACDLLIMSKINVTLKVICAINNQKHIVTPSYLDAMYEHLMWGSEKPDPTKYLPEVVDQEVPADVSFHPDIRRQTLLEGLKFYFLSPVQFNKTNLAVSTAGGQPILLEDGSDEEAEAMTQDKTLVVLVTRDVMDTLSSASVNFVRTVMAALKRKNLRMITDPEIGTAILTCNMVDYCNPRAPLAANLQAAMASQMTMSQATDMGATQQSMPAAEIKQEFRPPRCSAPVPKKLEEKRETSIAQDVVKQEVISQDNAASPTRQQSIPLAACPANPKRAGLNVDRLIPSIYSVPLSPPKEVQKTERLLTPVIRRQDNQASSSSRLSGDLFSDSGPSHSTTDNNPQPITSASKAKVESEKVEDGASGLSVFARHRNNKRDRNAMSAGYSSGEDGDNDVKAIPAKQKRVASLFDEGDELGNEGRKNLSSKNSGRRKKKSLFDDDDEEQSTNRKKSLFDNEKDEFANKKTSLFDDNENENTYDSIHCHKNILTSKSKASNKATTSHPGQTTFTSTLNGAAGGHEIRINSDIVPDIAMEVNNSDSDNSVDKPSAVAPVSKKTLGRSNKERQGLSVTKTEPGLFSTSAEGTTSGAVTSRAGWVNVAEKKSSSHSHNGESEDEAEVDVKPQTELLKGADGKVLRNVCEVEVTELVARQPGSRSLGRIQQQEDESRGCTTNYKRFKKTRHAGAGKLPTIIGGRDLEEHESNAHKDLEDLFCRGRMREHEKEEENRKNKDLFEWDSKNKSKKTSNRCIR